MNVRWPAALAALLASLLAGCGSAGADHGSGNHQPGVAGGYRAEIVRIDVSGRRLTLKASMGQQTLRVAPGVAIDAIEPGDKVLLGFGTVGSESVVTRIERNPP